MIALVVTRRKLWHIGFMQLAGVAVVVAGGGDFRYWLAGWFLSKVVDAVRSK